MQQGLCFIIHGNIFEFRHQISENEAGIADSKAGFIFLCQKPLKNREVLEKQPVKFWKNQ